MATLSRSTPLPAQWTLGAAITTAAFGLAGAMHLVIAPMHLDHAWEHAAALATVGAADLAYTAAWLRRRSWASVWLGWFLGLTSLSLYAITRFLPLPFAGQPEEIEPLGFGTQCFEVAGLLSLASLAVLTGSGAGRVFKVLGLVSGLAVATAWLLFGAASLAAALLGAG